MLHPKIKIWYVSAYPQGIHVGDFVSSVKHKQRFLTETVAVSHIIVGPTTLRVKKIYIYIHIQNQIKPYVSWWYIEVLRHQTIGLCKKLNSRVQQG